MPLRLSITFLIFPKLFFRHYAADAAAVLHTAICTVLLWLRLHLRSALATIPFCSGYDNDTVSVLLPFMFPFYLRYHCRSCSRSHPYGLHLYITYITQYVYALLYNILIMKMSIFGTESAISQKRLFFE